VGEIRWVETAGNVQWEVRREVGQDVSDRDPGSRRLDAGKMCLNLDEERSSVQRTRKSKMRLMIDLFLGGTIGS
jgi:hypothetical protein